MYTIEKKTLTDIADAIREKTGKSELITPKEMAKKIRNIKSGDATMNEIFSDSNGALSGETIKPITDYNFIVISGYTYNSNYKYTTSSIYNVNDIDIGDPSKRIGLTNDAVYTWYYFVSSTKFTSIVGNSYKITKIYGFNLE